MAIEKLNNNFSANQSFLHVYSHGDFAHWNIMQPSSLAEQNNEKYRQIKIIDWELSGFRPAYFDVLHYYYCNHLFRHNMKPNILFDALIEDLGSYCDKSSGHEAILLYTLYQSIYYSRLHAFQTKWLHQYTLQLRGLLNLLHAL